MLGKGALHIVWPTLYCPFDQSCTKGKGQDEDNWGGWKPLVFDSLVLEELPGLTVRERMLGMNVSKRFHGCQTSMGPGRSGCHGPIAVNHDLARSWSGLLLPLKGIHVLMAGSPEVDQHVRQD